MKPQIYRGVTHKFPGGLYIISWKFTPITHNAQRTSTRVTESIILQERKKNERAGDRVPAKHNETKGWM
jgi:hypothetical protein